MALPKLSSPTLTFTLPLAKKKIVYRRFTVKEEKILLIAAESGTQDDLVQAFRQVINNCIVNEGIDIDSLPMFDLEVLFLLLRINSVSNISEFRVPDPDGELYTIELDIQKVVDEIIAKLVVPDKTIQLTDDVGVVMRDVTLESFGNVEAPGEVTSDDAFKLLGTMIEKVFDADNVYPTKDFSEAEILEFIESFTPAALEKVQEYVLSMPKLQYTVEYKRKDGSSGELKLDGLVDFFQSA